MTSAHAHVGVDSVAQPNGRSSLSAEAVDQAITGGLDYLSTTQSLQGSWRGDYGGPLFLLPLYVASVYIMGQTRALPSAVSLGGDTGPEMARYMLNQQNDDGSWGLHVEGPGMVYTTCANYVALRLLDTPADDPALAAARRWMNAHGGPTKAAPWGKLFLALLGLLPYEGMLSTSPELWLLPDAWPVHPGRMWCHARMVYLPMSYLYGRRVRAEDDALLDEIRAEIYTQSYDDIDWAATATDVADTDEYTPLTPAFRAVNAVLGAWERLAPRPARQPALDYVLDQVGREDANTDYICIGPINKLLNTLCWYVARPDGPELARHLDQLPDYLWHADGAIKMQGYNSSQLWDTAFAVQAICATGRQTDYPEMIDQAFGYIEANQVLEDVDDRHGCYRSRSVGGWPFSNLSHGWPITDCTAEGLKSSMLLGEYVDEPLADWRKDEAVEQMLALQNDDGGWASYERTRAPEWMELFNPAACFGSIMIDYSYVECTSACMQALASYRQHDPQTAGRRIDRAIRAGADFLVDAQRSDGSWFGSWGICFTYGTWFGAAGLRAAGFDADHPRLQLAAEFLRAHQLPDGGWGELAQSCKDGRYVSTDEGQAVMTSWAMLALDLAGQADSAAFERGAKFLVDRQQDDGSWPDEHIAGMFNRTCAIHYDNYLKIFPVWALGVAQ